MLLLIILLVGNIKKILKLLNTKVEKKENSEWNRKIDEWKETISFKYAKDGTLKASLCN